jgi:hypothetical protein
LLGAWSAGRWPLGALLVTLLFSHLGVCQDAPSASVATPASCTHGAGHALLCSAETVTAVVAGLKPQRDLHSPLALGYSLLWSMGVAMFAVGRGFAGECRFSRCSHSTRLAVLQVLRR